MTAKVAVVDPAATVTFAGVDATPVLLVVRLIRAPPVGAATVRVTVPVEAAPPRNDVGYKRKDDSETGLIVRVAVRVVPANDPEIITVVEVATTFVLIVNVAVVAPPATVTLAGTAAAPGLLLVRTMIVPPAGAALLRFIVPVEALPPATVVGLTVSVFRAAAVTCNVALALAP